MDGVAAGAGVGWGMVGGFALGGGVDEAWEIRLKGGFTVIGVKAGLVLGTMRKRGRVWAS